MNAKATLERAKQFAQTLGVNRDGNYINTEDGSVCILGATYLAAGARLFNPSDEFFYIDYGSTDRDEFRAASAALYAIHDGRVTEVNDYSTNDQEVFDFFDRAIASLGE